MKKSLILKILSSISLLLCCLLLSPAVNIFAMSISDENFICYTIWLLPHVLSFVFALIIFIKERQTLPLFDRLFPLLLTLFSLFFSWGEAIFLDYDSYSKNQLFNTVALSALTIILLFTAYRIKKELTGHPTRNTN